MSRNMLPEEPLFKKETTESLQHDLSLERLEKKNEIVRKNNLQRFGFRAFYITLGVLVGVVVLDIIEQKLNIQNELLKEAFNVVKYATTTILGFLFANNSK